MAVGEQLYRLDERAFTTTGGSVVRAAYEIVGTPAAAAQISVQTPVALGDEIIVVLGVTFLATPGAAQTVIGAAIDVRLPNTLITHRLYEWGPPFFSGVAAQVQRVSASIFGCVIMPGECLFGTVVFNAGAAANTCTLGAYGFKVPRGNFRN